MGDTSHASGEHTRGFWRTRALVLLARAFVILVITIRADDRAHTHGDPRRDSGKYPHNYGVFVYGEPARNKGDLSRDSGECAHRCIGHARYSCVRVHDYGNHAHNNEWSGHDFFDHYNKYGEHACNRRLYKLFW